MQKKIVKYFRLLLAFRCMKEENNEVTIGIVEEARVKHFGLQLALKRIKKENHEVTIVSEMDMSRTYVLHYER